MEDSNLTWLDLSPAMPYYLSLISTWKNIGQFCKKVKKKPEQFSLWIRPIFSDFNIIDSDNNNSMLIALASTQCVNIQLLAICFSNFIN